MAHAIRNFLANEQCASSVLIAGSVALMTLGLVVAVGAIIFMK